MNEFARALYIPPGNPGILVTVDRMRLFVRQSLGSPWIRWAFGRMVQSVPLSQMAPDVRIGHIYEWVLRHLTYVYDGQASDSVLALDEEIRSPEYLLHRIYQFGTAEGDCDDFVILLAALLIGSGTRVRFVLTSARDDQEFDHVFLQAWTGQGWLTLDGIHGADLDWMVPMENVTNMQMIDV